MKNLNSKRVFLVDDDPFWLSMLSQMLNNLGMTNIATFSSGKECLENMNMNPSLIFLDYEMEEVNGLGVLEKIKRTNPETEVIFCTAHEDLEVASDALGLGSFDYLLKENASERLVKSILKKLDAK